MRFCPSRRRRDATPGKRVKDKHRGLGHKSLAANHFGRRLSELRTRRRESQLSLALAANISQRHLSFVESGRTLPSRDMVVRLPGMMKVIENLRSFVPELRETVMLPGCGHWTQQERPTEVNAALIRFLRALP